MKRFRLIRQTRQTTEYSCGACALQSVLGYWGHEVDEAEMMQRLGTTPEEGTYPEEIVRVARELGFEAELRENLTVDEVEQATRAGHPVVVLGQAWRSRGHSDAAAEDQWADGHYFVVLAVDRDYVYFEDPYMRMGKGFMPRAAFDALWHNVMGGDLAKPQQMRMGIFIRGDKPAAPQRLSDANFAALDFASLGSMNLLVAQFEGYLLPYPFISELRELWAGGIVQPDAYIFLRKDIDGKVAAIEGGNLEEAEDRPEVNAVLAAIAGLARGATEEAAAGAAAAARDAGADFGLSAEELHRIADKLPPGHSAVIVLVENLWERKFREAVAKHNGSLISQRWYGADNLARLGERLAASATRREEAKA
jgi:predicted double-glycine peptidase